MYDLEHHLSSCTCNTIIVIERAAVDQSSSDDIMVVHSVCSCVSTSLSYSVWEVHLTHTKVHLTHTKVLRF